MKSKLDSKNIVFHLRENTTRIKKKSKTGISKRYDLLISSAAHNHLQSILVSQQCTSSNGSITVQHILKTFPDNPRQDGLHWSGRGGRIWCSNVIYVLTNANDYSSLIRIVWKNPALRTGVPLTHYISRHVYLYTQRKLLSCSSIQIRYYQMSQNFLILEMYWKKLWLYFLTFWDFILILYLKSPCT